MTGLRSSVEQQIGFQALAQLIHPVIIGQFLSGYFKSSNACVTSYCRWTALSERLFCTRRRAVP